MSEKIGPIGPKVKLYTKGVDEHITYEDYVAENAKATGLPPEMIGKITRTVKAGQDFEIPEDLPEKKAKKAKAFIVQAKADMKAHAKNKKTVEANDVKAKEAREAEKAAEKAAAEKDLKESAEMMQTGLAKPALVKASAQLTDGSVKAIANSLPKGITISDTGEVTVQEGLDKKSYAEAFAALVTMNQVGGAITDRSAKTEAQVAFSARAALGKSWVNLLKVTNEKDLSRINKGIKTFEVCSLSKAGKAVFLALPLSTTATDQPSHKL